MSASEKAQQTRLAKHRALIEKAKAKAMGPKQTSSQGGSVSKVRAMAYAYEEILGEYLHAPTLRYIKGKLDPKHRSFSRFRKAFEIAEAYGVDCETYVRSQFYWFDKWFNRAPKPYELCSTRGEKPAPWRLAEYLDLTESGEIRPKVQSIAFQAKIDPTKLDKINQKRLTELQQVWGLTEEDVLLRFAQRVAGYFDQEWLRKQPTYRRLRKAGKI